MRKKEFARLSSGGMQTKLFGIEMLTPTILVLLVMTAYPLISTLIYSFTNYNYLKHANKAADFVLFKNYIDLFQNEYFRQAVINTIKFTILAVVLEMVLGLLVAVFIHSLKRGTEGHADAAAATVPAAGRDGGSELAHDALLQLRHHQSVPHQPWACPTTTGSWTPRRRSAPVLVIDVWQNVPFVLLLLFASLQSVPEGQYEAARIDGADTLHQFWYITIPNIKNSLALCALLRTIDTFRLFEKVNVLTGGGPAGTTTTITQYLYNYGIKSLDFGFGSAGAIVMTLLVLILSSFYIKRAMG